MLRAEATDSRGRGRGEGPPASAAARPGATYTGPGPVRRGLAGLAAEGAAAEGGADFLAIAETTASAEVELVRRASGSDARSLVCSRPPASSLGGAAAPAAAAVVAACWRLPCPLPRAPPEPDDDDDDDEDKADAAEELAAEPEDGDEAPVIKPPLAELLLLGEAKEGFAASICTWGGRGEPEPPWVLPP